MTFHEGQEVLVLRYDIGADRRSWSGAMIDYKWQHGSGDSLDWYCVAFSDGTKGDFDTDHIRQSKSPMKP